MKRNFLESYGGTYTWIFLHASVIQDERLYEAYGEIDELKISKLADSVVRNIIHRGEDEARMIEKENDPEVLLKLLKGKCDPA
ncbi:hypothetical protein V7D15_06275 [Thermoanaerobacter thermohydrosulfuricus]